MNKIFLILGLFLFYFIISCSSSQVEKNTQQPYVKKSKSIFYKPKNKTVIEKNFSVELLNDSLAIGGIYFKHYLVRNLLNECDRIDGYWAFINDTLYYVSKLDYKNNCINLFPFFSVVSSKEYVYRESECHQNIDPIVFGQSGVDITILEKQYDEINKDTIYYIKHNCGSISGSDHPDFLVRYFKISLNRGILDYTVYGIDTTSISFPY